MFRALIICCCIALPPLRGFAADLPDAQAKKFFNDHGCNACHGVDELRIGPAYRSIAGRYRNADADTIAALELKVRYGGAGSWGTVPMISNPMLSEAQLRAIVAWILTLKSQ